MRLIYSFALLIAFHSTTALAEDPAPVKSLPEAAAGEMAQDDPEAEPSVNELLDKAVADDDVEALKQAFGLGVSFKVLGAAAELVIRASAAGSWQVVEELLKRRDVSAVGVSLNNFPSLPMLKKLVSKGADPSPAFSVNVGKDEKQRGLIVFGEQNPQVALVLRHKKRWKVIDATPPEKVRSQTQAVDLVVENALLQVLYMNDMEDVIGKEFFRPLGQKVSLKKLTALRLKKFPFAENCVWMEMVGQNMIFWDLYLRNKPYDCADDSQVSDPDPKAWHVPRYYRLNPKNGRIKMIKIKAKHCRRPVKDGKVVCK